MDEITRLAFWNSMLDVFAEERNSDPNRREMLLQTAITLAGPVPNALEDKVKAALKGNTKDAPAPGPSNPAESWAEVPVGSWAEVPALIEARPAKSEMIAYGISRAICGRELLIDFGDELGGISLVKITFRDEEVAWAAHCKGIRLAIKVVEHPELAVKTL